MLALAQAQASGLQAVQQLSSGRRINSASDDAAGLAISTRMTSQITGMDVASRNAQDAISMTQTAEGGLSSISSNLQRLRELSVQAANASNSALDRAALQREASSLVGEIDRVAVATSFNGQSLLDGRLGPVNFQVGANDGEIIDLSALASMRSSVLGAAATSALPSTTTLNGNALTAASTLTGPGQLVINGVDVWQGGAVNADAKDLAAAINAAGITGLSASAAANMTVGTSTVGGYGLLSINDGGVLHYDYRGMSESDIASSMIFFMNNGLAPGLTAADNGAGVTLTALDGRNITLNFNGGTPPDVGLGGVAYGNGVDGVTFSHVNLSYNGTTGLSISGSRAAALGLPAATALPSTTTSPISQIDLSTVAGANAALGSLDLALDTVVGQRALLGAAQSCFASAINELQSALTNTSASRSRIVDADYGRATSNLVHSKVLQQAAMAMVAQANAQKSDVLKLLTF